MALRIWLLNGENISQDYDFWYLLQSISDGWYIEGLEVQTGKVTAWKWFIPCERTNGNKPFVFVELDTDYALDTTWSKKVWIEIDQWMIDDWSENPEDWTGVASIKTWANYPAWNYIPLASITGWTITDERIFLKVKQSRLDLPTFNQSIKDLNDVNNFANPTVKKFLVRDEVEEHRTIWEIEISDIPSDNVKQYILWENIASAWVVSLMPDWKVYKQWNNKRLMNNWTITGQSYTKSCLINWWTKIATLWLATNTLTLWIWTIDYATNTITYWTGVLVSSNCANGARYFNICEANTDTVYISYTHTWNYGAGRSSTISWTVPTIWNETNMTGTSAWHQSLECAKVNNGIIGVILTYWESTVSNTRTVCWVTVSWTTITKWTEATLYGYTNRLYTNDWLFRIVNDLLLVAYWYNYNWNNIYRLVSFSGATPTAWTEKSYGTGVTSADYTFHMCTDWTNIYTVCTDWYLRKYTYSWNTLTEVWNKSSFPNAWMIILWNSLIWVNSTWTSIAWYSVDGVWATLRNTIDYWIALTRLWFETYYTTDNYSIFTVSWNPSYIYKIWNENRNISWYLKTSWNLWDTKDIYLPGSIITWLSNIIPWMPYYLSYTDWSIWPVWDLLFGKWVSSTEIKENIWVIA